MGNRAMITTRSNYNADTIGIYLHWNGGRDSVEAFLKYCKLRGFRSPDSDSAYCLSRLTQIIGNFFGGGLSVGLFSPQGFDEDNGIYIIGGDWEIVDRINFEGAEQAEYNLADAVISIDAAQPERDQLGKETIAAMLIEEAVPVSYEEKLDLIEAGTELIVVGDLDGTAHKYNVLGFGKRGAVRNGQDVAGVPFYDFTKYSRFSDYSDETQEEKIERLRRNINAYLTPSKKFYITGDTERKLKLLGVEE